MNKIFKINALRDRAEKFARELTKNEEIFKEDISKLVEAEERYQIRNGEIVIEEIHAKPRLGKSTLAIYRAKYIIDDELKKCGKKDKKIKFGMRNIARDDQEYSKIMRKPDWMNDVIVTDEQNELERGGENSSVEQQLKNVFSDVQAGRYIHRICVSPESEIDRNSDILLEVVGTDTKDMITHCRCYYRISNAQNKYWQPIGHVNVCVKDLIWNWEKNVKKVFFKKEKTKEDIEYLKKQCKEDFYVEYIIKKYEKMELLIKEHVLRPRELDYAEVVLNVINKLYKLTKIMTVDEKLIKNYIEIEFRKLGLVASMVGIKLATDRVNGIIGLYRSVWKTEAKMMTVVKKMKEKDENQGKINNIEIEYENILKELNNAIKIQIDELERYKMINEKYNEHLK